MTKTNQDSEPNFQQVATELIQEFIGGDPQAKAKEYATEATQFIQKNPWVAVAGAVVVGYLLASMTSGSRQGSRSAPNR